MTVNEFATKMKTVVEELRTEELPPFGQEVLYLIAAIYVTRREK